MDKRQFWLMKSEPDVYSIDTLIAEENQTTMWEGIRNYEARNFMRDKMKVGDGVLFYHSNAKPPSIVGTARISSDPYPDPFQFDASSKYFDPKSSEGNPRWILVDVTFVQKFETEVTRNQLKEHPLLSEMQIFKRNRLSITSVSEEEWLAVHELANAKVV